jgi:hypothetical protein
MCTVLQHIWDWESRQDSPLLEENVFYTMFGSPLKNSNFLLFYAVLNEVVAKSFKKSEQKIFRGAVLGFTFLLRNLVWKVRYLKTLVLYYKQLPKIAPMLVCITRKNVLLECVTYW